MVRDAEAVRLVAHALDEVQRRAVAVQQDGLRLPRQEDLLQPLGQAEDRHVKARLQHGAAREVQLFGAAVDQNQVRQVGKLALGRVAPRRLQLRPLALGVLEPAGDDLVHGREVVCAHDRLDAEVAVFLLGRHAVDEHDHRRDGQHALRVGDVVALDAPRIARHAHRLAQRLGGADGARLLALQARVALLQRVLGVLVRHLHELVLRAALGHAQRHLCAALLAQVALQLLRAGRERFDDQLRGDHLRVLVKLRDEALQHLRRWQVARAFEREVLPADHVPAAHEQHLHHRVQAVLMHRQDVLIAAAHIDGLLPLHQALHRADAVAIDARLLKAHRRGRLLHLLSQVAQYGLALAREELDHLIHVQVVFVARAQARARGQALADLVMQTGPARPVHRIGARAQREHLAQHIQHLAHAAPAHVWPEVARAVLLHAAHHLHAREVLGDIYAQVGVVLVVLEEDVVVGLVQLDEVALQDQRFEVGVDQDDVKVIDLLDHGRHLGRVLARLEVRAHAVFEVLGLADIDDLSVGLHQVTSGAVGQLLDLEAQQFVHAGRPFGWGAAAGRSGASKPEKGTKAVRSWFLGVRLCNYRDREPRNFALGLSVFLAVHVVHVLHAVHRNVLKLGLPIYRSVRFAEG